MATGALPALPSRLVPGPIQGAPLRMILRNAEGRCATAAIPTNIKSPLLGGDGSGRLGPRGSEKMFVVVGALGFAGRWYGAVRIRENCVGPPKTWGGASTAASLQNKPSWVSRKHFSRLYNSVQYITAAARCYQISRHNASATKLKGGVPGGVSSLRLGNVDTAP